MKNSLKFLNEYSKIHESEKDKKSKTLLKFTENLDDIDIFKIFNPDYSLHIEKDNRGKIVDFDIFGNNTSEENDQLTPFLYNTIWEIYKGVNFYPERIKRIALEQGIRWIEKLLLDSHPNMFEVEPGSDRNPC